MKKNRIFGLLVVVFLMVFVTTGCGNNANDKTNTNDDTNPSDTIATETETSAAIVEIPVENVSGITPQQAAELCYTVMGEKDEATGFTFSFGVSAAVERNQKQYYVVRASWLVDNSHLSYIGDFFVAADGKEIFSGIFQPDEILMSDLIWSR